MPARDVSLNTISVLLKPEARSTMLIAMASVIMRAGSCVETTLELTNRVYDRYFPSGTGPKF